MLKGSTTESDLAKPLSSMKNSRFKKSRAEANSPSLVLLKAEKADSTLAMLRGSGMNSGPAMSKVNMILPILALPNAENMKSTQHGALANSKDPKCKKSDTNTEGPK